ncbi:hypothetical protein R3751_16310 [Halorubrum distributum]|uniref:hypothetical protein n=1 Tax=Halorubrum distributum TaxID=29283 RepID=UPI002953B8D5|nr:hypothetical protein [Halorubrum distributum]MDV7351328.1 hypothetical protein [Halorubrum distributum]
MSDDAFTTTHAQLAEYLRLNPDATAIEAVGHAGADPSRWVDAVEDALAEETPHAALGTPTDADGRTDPDTPESPEHGEEDTRSDRPNPTPDAGGSPSTTPEPTDDDATPGEKALADGLKWFADQLDRELPESVDHDTPRDYYHARGWSDATIDAKGLGYAPADTGDQLLAHLHRKGHDRDAILASGLFREWDDGNLSATWSGRFVLPYLDAESRPVFAISRATEPADPSDWAGRYDADDDPAKYHKIAVSREEVTVEEPIYGLDTVRDGEPVLITEGIADAIAAHQAGYPCLSPVTTSFKTEDRERLVDALEEYAVPRVYLVQDAERPGSSVDDRDRLTLPQYGEGTKGAVRTAEYLAEHGADARIGELPRPGLDKVDLDDYLRVWSDDLAPILAGATPVEEHPAHDPDAAKRAAIDAAERTDPSPASGSGAGSALFDLDITDVTGLATDYRGASPLGHHGESENYFTLLDDGLAFDHKHKAAYNGLTYLLADAGERPPARPNGRIDDAELLAAWVHAKGERLIPEDDPIPRRALRSVARDATGWDGELVEHETGDGDTFDGLPRDVYNDALAAVREEYDLDPERRPAGGRSDPDAEPVAPIPLGRLDALDDDARKRAARKRGLEIPSTDDARGRLRDAVLRELRAGNTTVLDAPTALGKSYRIATEPWGRRESTTGGAPVIHFHQTREARDDAMKATADSSATGDVLLGRKEASPVARGDHDRPEDPDAEDAPDQIVTIDGEDASDWFDTMCDDRGLPFSTALAIARDRNDQGLDELPPFGEEDPAVAQWNDLPRDDDGEPAVDVIHATHQFAHVPSLRTHTNVILDEQPDYRSDLSDQQVRDMVNAYLRAIDAPTTHFEGFVMLARNDDARGDAAAERDALDDALGEDADLPAEWYAETDGAHALAPDLTRAIWNALRWEDPNRNGLRSTKVYHEPPRFDADKEGYAAGTWLSVVLDDADHSVHTVRATPDFSQARAVVGLDAHPSMPMWELNGPPGVTRDTVLDPTERRLWRRYERGLTVAQIGDAARPRSGGDALEWMNEERVRTLLDALREHYGDGFKTALSTVQTEPALRRLLADVTGEPVEDVRDQTLHYGEEKSRNDFAEEDAGYVYGCMDPGDGMIVDALAELNLDATPATVETEDGEEKREKGRTFDGPDADKAAAVLASVRENHVAQAAGRYAREPSDPESRATVYVDTNAAPAGFVDLEVPGVEWLASDLQRTIVEELTERPSATTRELAEAADCTKEHVRETLARLEEHGLVSREERAGAHGADVYHDAGADAGIVDLGETTNDPLMDSNRWSLAIRDRHAREESVDPSGGSSSTPNDGLAGGDDPPDPPS